MKRRDERPSDAQAGLFKILAAIDDPEMMGAFMVDLCTPAELEALADRWRIVPLLRDGVSYRKIHEQTGVSVTTIGRVARYISSGAGGYDCALALSDKSSRK
ncbi:trp operon repressor [Actinomycetaceae bacterium TAE3-ERU4]|nr:trp operon repressor [Actinomycetaceae bacterium TAE3-ERU4]